MIRRPGRGMEGERAGGPAAPAESGTSEAFAQLWADVMGILVSGAGAASGSGAACRGTGRAAERRSPALLPPPPPPRWRAAKPWPRRRVPPAPAAASAPAGERSRRAGSDVPERVVPWAKPSVVSYIGDRFRLGFGGKFRGLSVQERREPGAEPRWGAGVGVGVVDRPGPERSGPRVCLHAQKRLLRLINGRIVSCCSGTLADAVTFGRKAGVLLPLHSTHVFSASRRQARVKPRVPRGRAARPAALPGCRSWSSYSRRFFGSELLGYGPRSFCAGDLLRRD